MVSKEQALIIIIYDIITMTVCDKAFFAAICIY